MLMECRHRQTSATKEAATIAKGRNRLLVGFDNALCLVVALASFVDEFAWSDAEPLNFGSSGWIILVNSFAADDIGVSIINCLYRKV